MSGNISTPGASPVQSLSGAQERHLRELYGDGSKTLYWHLYGSGQHRCARALVRLGLIERAGYSLDTYCLSDEGERVAKELCDAD